MIVIQAAKSIVARRLLAAGVLAVLGSLAGSLAGASVVNMGYASYDVTSVGASAEVDITNLTGANALALGDPDFPVATAVSLSSLSLTVDFSDGSTQTFGSSYFTLSADGLSFNGNTIGIGGLNPSPTKAVLTGDFDATGLTLLDGSTTTIDASFSAIIVPSSGSDLEDGDYALIEGTVSSSTPPPVSEPGPLGLALAGAALAGLGLVLRRRRGAAIATAAAAMALSMGLAPGAASAAVTLSTAATPSSGVAGVTTVNLTASGLPAGLSASKITVTLAPTCAAQATGPVSGELTTVASGLSSILSLSRIGFQIPATAAQETYYASVSGMGFASSDCAIVAVTHTSTALSACVPTSSLAIATGTNVIAYVPNGSWGTGTTGIEAVEIEGASPGPLKTIATGSVEVNSCAANPATGEAVCTGNNTSIFLIDGATQTLSATLTSGATAEAGFSGGYCYNCGVAVNALTNTAYISEGDAAAASESAIQTLNLTSKTFGPVIATAHEVSEDISVDPSRNLLLSPDEEENYDLFQLSSTGALLHEYGDQFTFASQGDGYFDSAAEDCSTGIALSSLEATSNVFLTDLTQATFKPAVAPATAGTWTAPNETTTLAASFSAGTDGISVASGSSHLGVVTGEFGGDNFAVLQLPATSGSGTPALVDYAVAVLPPTPDGYGFSMGYDPHTITAYTSPNTGKAYAVIADWARGSPSYVAVIDLQALLAATRTSGTHNVDPSVSLLTTGIVRYVATH